MSAICEKSLQFSIWKFFCRKPARTSKGAVTLCNLITLQFCCNTSCTRNFKVWYVSLSPQHFRSNKNCKKENKYSLVSQPSPFRRTILRCMLIRLQSWQIWWCAVGRPSTIHKSALLDTVFTLPLSFTYVHRCSHELHVLVRSGNCYFMWFISYFDAY